MTLIIVSIIIIAYILFATELSTNINKAAVAIFAGTVSWVLYICWGSDYVMSQHQGEYLSWLGEANATSVAVKEYIASNIFLRHVGRSAEIVLFLLSTMTIVEILYNNGCFDYFSLLTRTKNSRKYIWIISLITLLLSANLDNLSTSIMMLTIMIKTVNSHRWRLIYGAAIVISANFGGAMTVIGDPIGLLLWNMGAVSASGFFLKMLIPAAITWATTIYLLSRMLPGHIELVSEGLPYRGDDTNLNIWQRGLMLFVGIGGLWFIPTFHNITKLSPFLGALCVLSVLWIVNEIFNHRLMNVDKMIGRKIPRTLQYGVTQMALYVLGIMMAIAVIQEIGVIDWLNIKLHGFTDNAWLMGSFAGALSLLVDNFTAALTAISFHNVDVTKNTIEASYYAHDGFYWPIVTYMTTLGGCLLGIGTISGLAFFKMERVTFMWYLRNITPKLFIGGSLGLIALVITQLLSMR